MNETWFSNQLAWLMDPKGSHGLGSEFIKEFLQSEENRVLDKSIILDNFQVIREFYLDIEGRRNRRHIDIVMLDFEQDVIVVIENKLYGENSKNQLSDNFFIEKMFPDMKIHYIYLSLEGNINLKQEIDENRQSRVSELYIQKNWSKDFKSILENRDYDNYYVFKLLVNIKKALAVSNSIIEKEFKDLFIKVLNYLEKKHSIKKRNWGVNENRSSIVRISNKKNNKNSITFNFDKTSVTVSFEKIKYVVPFEMDKKQQELMLVNIAIRAFSKMKKISLEVNANDIYKNLNKIGEN